jgi:membrane protease YdiL (CAAX protease family)
VTERPFDESEHRPVESGWPTESELAHPNLLTIGRIVGISLWRALKERPGQIILSAYFLIMLWGTHGNLELLKYVIPGWEGPGSDPDRRKRLLPGVPWDHELISFLGGFFLLVLVPIVLIKKVFRQSLADYGLGLPERRWDLARLVMVALGSISVLPFIHATQDPDMRKTYPLYRKLDPNNPRQFILYELCYLPFFVTIEFIFRGYLLFGLAGLRTEVEKHARMHSETSGARAEPRSRFFTRSALLIQMLSYTAWHLGKPLPELWGTFAWGPVAGATAYTVRSIWPIVAVHWLLNVALDALILRQRNSSPVGGSVAVGK